METDDDYDLGVLADFHCSGQEEGSGLPARNAGVDLESKPNEGDNQASQSTGDNGGSGSQGMKEDFDLDLWLALESSSSTSSTMERISFDRDTRNKRPKVHSFPRDWGSHSGDETHYIAPIHGVVNDKDVPDSSVAGENARSSNDTLTKDELDVRMDLTDDLLHMVFSFLDHSDLCRVAMVCRHWRDASSHEDFWRYLNFENRYISPQQCLTVFDMLKSLTINDATLGSGSQEIRIYHDRLRDLQIVKCHVIRISIRCPQLESLSLSCSTLPHAVLNCPLLRELDISFCQKFTDTSIRSAATSCPLLESLDVSNCTCITDDTLREIGVTCGNLHFLDASYCTGISLEPMRLPMLTVLKLYSCKAITSASTNAIAFSYMLEVLDLANCSLLTELSLDLPHLKKIRFVHCLRFCEFSLRSNMLSSITISSCPWLQRISITSNALKKLVLQKQESLTTLSLQCPLLEEVDLTECKSLTCSISKVFSDVGGCPGLRSLVLDNCKSLTTMSLISTSIVSLSLIGCWGITSHELKCASLVHVSLDGCDHLERASFSPVGLMSLNLGICPRLNVLHVQAPQMISIKLEGCGVLSEAFIDCPHLTSLDASFCSQLKDECLSATTSSCHLIESLVLMSCPLVGPYGLSTLHFLPNLTYHDLSYTFLVNLQPVFDSCLYLKVLKLQACKSLSESSLKPLYNDDALPALSELDLFYGTHPQSAIEELLACCMRLTRISLNGCVNMYDFDLSEISPSLDPCNWMLQSLNCVGCPNIKKVVIPPTPKCLRLSSLNLSLSSKLKEVDVSCRNLSSLNFSNCSSLEILKLDCPRLTSLSHQSCNTDEATVEAAVMNCKMLKTLNVRSSPKICQSSIGTLRVACPSLKRIFSSVVP